MLLAPLFVIAFGLIVGSFLNVCIYRLPQGQSVVLPGSACPRCGRPIRAWENIPLLSYLLLLGRCRGCGARISWVYPMVEASTGLLFYLLFLKYGISPPFLVNVLFFALLVPLIFIDLFERILPNVLTLGGLCLGLLLSPLQEPEFFQAQNPPVSIFHWNHYLHSLLGIAVGGGFLWLVAVLYLKWRKVEGMGFGDIKMMAMVGAFVGWRFTWLTILIGSFLGALIGSLFIYLSHKNRNYELPFGSFLGVGAIVSTLFGCLLFDWYFGFF